MGSYKIKKLACVVLVIFCSASLLSAQNLAEVAKKEKERREILRAKGKKSILVTNIDLKKRKRLPMISAKPVGSTSERSTQSTPASSSGPSQKPTPQQKEQSWDRSSGSSQNRNFATKVLFASDLVKNPEFALKKSDGKFAKLSLYGVLELEVNLKNGPGDDIAIHSSFLGSKEEMPGGEEEGGIPETLGIGLHGGLWYGVLAMNRNGEWEAIGRGQSALEKFDLGGLSSTKKIRIIFKPFKNPDLPVKRMRRHSRELTCGIDAIEVLH